jgi:phosphoribosylformylglycinamidine synthase
MLRLNNIAALSPFRERKLLAQLSDLEPAITNVNAEYIHFIDTEKKLSAKETTQLQGLLTYGTPFLGSRQGQLLLVTPRRGTLSPWSSKATDIAHNCGLTNVRRIEKGIAYYLTATQPLDLTRVGELLYDRMTETVFTDLDQAETLLTPAIPKQLNVVDVLKKGKAALQEANSAWGLALADDEIDYLVTAYRSLGCNPTDAELMMFGLVNSEHCRHKVFNADWIIDGAKQSKSLFKMIRNTYEQGGEDVLSAYSDNAAVLRGPDADLFFPDPADATYRIHREPSHLVIKVETHNHPTAIAPFPGAATGVGGEIRDEGATGRGAKPKMGLSGFTVSNLSIPGAIRAWEQPYGKSGRIASALDIMIDAPLGGATFNNEFGRPNLAGYFRTYQQASPVDGQVWGYHKPIMLAGGLGAIGDGLYQKRSLPVGAKIILLGGPAMLIGLGGGSASSMQSGAIQESLDFASVQRGNPEMQRRAQEVISSAVALGAKNPIITIHDVGAGGWSNALSELAHDSKRGAHFELRDMPNADPGLSPMEIWCNEAQERYVLGIAAEDLASFQALCERERCPFAVVGETTAEERLIVHDRLFGRDVINLPMSVLFGKPPKMTRRVARSQTTLPALKTKAIALDEAVQRVLQLPAVSSKKFLITIGDRTVGGLTVRDQMVGPWQVPVSDVAVTASGFASQTGEAMSMGERSPLALINAPASARMAVGEALTNIAAASIGSLSDVKLSANWMAAVGFGQEDEKLFDAVTAIGEDFCPLLGLTIPVGKDSLSMRSTWQEEGKDKSVVSPLSLIITAFAPVQNATRTLTPQLATDVASELLFIDLGEGQNRLGASALAQVYNQLGNEAPDANPALLKQFFSCVQELNEQGALLAYHDRSDGGLLTTLAEMAFAGRCGLNINLSDLPGELTAQLFNEELGAVLQVKADEAGAIYQNLHTRLGGQVYRIGKPTTNQEVVINSHDQVVYRNTRSQLEQWWAETSYLLQARRDNAVSAGQEFAAIADDDDPGISPVVTFALSSQQYADRPKVAIFREQGVNGQVEMAAAFDQAGFTAVDVHLSDIVRGVVSLDDFVGLAACGGFSYGDVLGAGEGWAKSILFNPKLRQDFQTFFARPDTFSLGVCNGCQMLAALKELIPGAATWPTFLKNTSEQFEARLATVKITDSPSIFFKDMAGAVLPVPVAHGEGRAQFASAEAMTTAQQSNLVALQYVTNAGTITERYPSNPNGSPEGITALTTPDGRATILMPHPERAFLTSQHSWHPAEWDDFSPWFRMFQNARQWVDGS